jgi:hypothetical protein
VLCHDIRDPGCRTRGSSVCWWTTALYGCTTAYRDPHCYRGCTFWPATDLDTVEHARTQQYAHATRYGDLYTHTISDAYLGPHQDTNTHTDLDTDAHQHTDSWTFADTCPDPLSLPLYHRPR